jgi:hypothetical protein
MESVAYDFEAKKHYVVPADRAQQAWLSPEDSNFLVTGQDAPGNGSLRAIFRSCHTFVFNFGLHAIGWPGVRDHLLTYSANDLAAYMLQMFTAIDDTPEVANHTRWIWSTTEPCPDSGIFQCPPRDYRYTAYIEFYKVRAIRKFNRQARRTKIQVMDIYPVYNAVAELTRDQCHYGRPISSAGTALLLRTLFPECTKHDPAL